MTEFDAGLYVVATPIGNLNDLSPRASAVLRAATIIAAEDTRTSTRLIADAPTRPTLVSLTEHNVTSRTASLLEAANDGVVALVSDAGSPAIADPGTRLIEAAHAAGIRVTPIPGPSALTAALSVAGFDAADAHFLGFLPRQRAERAARLKSAAAAAAVLVFFESPNRLSATLTELATDHDDPETVVCRELTKLYEEVVRGPASELAERFATARGECTVVVRVPERQDADTAALRQYMAEMREAGARRTAAAPIAARRFGVTRAEAYEAWE